MSDSNRIYLIDTNSIITPFKTYYPFDFAQKFWIQLEEKIVSGDIVILDVVYDELKKGDDELKEWIMTFDKNLFLSINNADIVDKYSEVINYIDSANCYNSNALKAWADVTIADPWLIAAGKVYDYTLVTLEKRNANLSYKNPSKSAKIPDVAEEFGVDCCDLFQMMRELNFVF